MRDLTTEEDHVLKLMGEAWNAACRLPDAHPSDLHELSHALNAAENIIFARPAVQAQGRQRASIAT